MAASKVDLRNSGINAMVNAPSRALKRPPTISARAPTSVWMMSKMPRLSFRHRSPDEHREIRE
jgi:hypothetical protein